MKLYFSILIIYLTISLGFLIKLLDSSITCYERTTGKQIKLGSIAKAFFAIGWPIVLYFLYRDYHNKS